MFKNFYSSTSIDKNLWRTFLKNWLNYRYSKQKNFLENETKVFLKLCPNLSLVIFLRERRIVTSERFDCTWNMIQVYRYWSMSRCGYTAHVNDSNHHNLPSNNHFKYIKFVTIHCLFDTCADIHFSIMSRSKNFLKLTLGRIHRTSERELKQREKQSKSNIYFPAPSSITEWLKWSFFQLLRSNENSRSNEVINNQR